MRHAKKKITLGREKGPRQALLRNLTESLILHGAIVTTVAKAKAIRTIVEPLITKAKANTLAARRLSMRVLYTDDAINKLLKDLAPRYRERHGGYTRITKLGYRMNDRGAKARIEFV